MQPQINYSKPWFPLSAARGGAAAAAAAAAAADVTVSAFLYWNAPFEIEMIVIINDVYHYNSILDVY